MTTASLPQSGILPVAHKHARFVIFNLGATPPETLMKNLAAFETGRARLQSQHPDAGLCSVIGFGPELWARLGQPTPPGLHALAPLESAQGEVRLPATGGDVMVHIHSDQADLCFALSSLLMDGLVDQVQVLDECASFRYLDCRDLTGFIDGTANAQGDAGRAEVALLDESAGPLAGGSFVFSSRFVHALTEWNKLDTSSQEAVIGRTKFDSVQFPEDRLQPQSHVGRMDVGMEVLRHSLPYGDSTGKKGIFFQAYCRDLSTLDHLLHIMYGKVDGLTDHLLKYTQAVSGAYFFAPSQDLLTELTGAEG